jgi:curved DNA-binding protein CbpA
MSKKKPNLMKKSDDLWKEICLFRAGYKSELSGKLCHKHGGSDILQVHHIARKPNYALRYDLEGGIVLTKGEHTFGIHGEREEEYRAKIKEVKGADIYERLASKKNDLSKKSIKEYYEELKKIKDELMGTV